MIEIPSTISTIWTYIRLVLDKFREIVMFVAGIIAKFVSIPQENIYNFIMIVVALWIAYKIFFIRNVTVQGRWLEYVIMALVAYFILKIV